MEEEVDIELFAVHTYILKVTKKAYIRMITDAGKESVLHAFADAERDEKERSVDLILREKGYFCNVKRIKNGQELINPFDLFG